MAEFLKTLGQNAPTATTLTDLYTVPASTSATLSSLVICNRSATATTFRVSVAPAGAADTVEHYLYYDQSIGGNSSYALTLGITLATTDKLRVYAGANTLSFSAFGVEVV